MEHESDDDVLIIEDDTANLMTQIDEVLSEEPVVEPAIQCGGLKRSFKSDRRGTPKIVSGSVTPNVTITPIAGTSSINQNLLTRLGPIVLPLASRLGPPSTSSSSSSSGSNTEAKVKRPRGPDHRPEQYRALTQQGLAALNMPEFVRPAVNRPFHSAAQYNRNELLWRELTHKDRTAREHSEWNLHLQKPRPMVKVKYETAMKLIDDTYKVVPNHRLSVTEFFEGDKVDDNDPRISAFEREVRMCGFMSFDTEGGGSLQSKDNKKESRRVFIAMSSPKTGQVLLFHCLHDVPKTLLSLLADYAIAKIQSNIAADVKILDDLGYNVRGLVDSGVLYTFIVPGTIEDGFGAKKQNQVLWPGSTHYVPYEHWTFNAAYQRQKLTERARRHVVQDVILPYAILFEAACQRVLQDKKPRDDIFPYVNELLELAYTREPTLIRAREPKESARDYWLPPITGDEFDLNSKSDVSLVRRARAAYVENFDGPTLQDRRKSAEAIWRSRQLPSTRNKIFRISNWSVTMVGCCHNCGEEDHQTTDCATPMVPCAIPHYPGMDWYDHSVLCCPQLHSRCTICRMRGHLDQQHPLLEQTPREFREDFWKYCHLGLFTSLPFLYGTDDRLRAHHWKANLMMNRQPRGWGELWLYCGLEKRFNQQTIDQVATLRQVVNKNLKSSIYTYQKLVGNAE